MDDEWWMVDGWCLVFVLMHDDQLMLASVIE